MRGAVPASRVQRRQVFPQKCWFELSWPCAVLSKMPMPSNCCLVRLPVESIRGSLAPPAARVLRESLNTFHKQPNCVAGLGRIKTCTNLMEEQDLPPCRANTLCPPSLRIFLRGEGQSIFASCRENAASTSIE